MPYSQKLKALFPEITLHPEDLLLLETFQIKYLPDRVVVKEFATLLRAYPVVHRFMVSKYPPIGSFLTRILEENESIIEKKVIEEQCQEAIWEIADLIIYNRNPELFDTKAPIRWEIDEINSIVSLEDKVVADVGAGSGRIAFLVAPLAQTVFAVEPIASFRSFMREKAVKNAINNVYVMDGTLDSIPLPDHTLDVLITSNAIGWNLQEELKEIERVLKPGGHAIHLLRSDTESDNPFHEILTSSPWDYSFFQGEKEQGIKLIYSKSL